jgi:hypothetical protein
MFRWMNWIAPAVALSAMVLFSFKTLKADDAAPAPAATGSLTISVVDSDGKPVTTAHVTVTEGKPKAKKKAPAEATPQAAEPTTKPAGLEGDVDATTGTITFAHVAPGTYHVAVKAKGFGAGKADATVTDAEVKVTVTLKPKAAKAG